MLPSPTAGIFWTIRYAFDKPSSGVSYMNARDAFRSLIFFLNEPKDTLLFGKLNAALAETALTPVMQYRNGGPQLYAVPPSLYHLMALEVAFAATHGAKSRVCPICSRCFSPGLTPTGAPRRRIVKTSAGQSPNASAPHRRLKPDVGS